MPTFGLPLLILLACNLLAAHESHAPKAEKPAAPARHAFDPSKSRDIASLRIIYRQDTALLLKKKQGWVTAGDLFPVDSAAMEEALDALLRIEAVPTAVAPGDTAKLRDYALLGPEARRLEWKEKSGKTTRIVFGRMMDPLTPEQYKALEIHTGDTASGEHGWITLPETDSTYWMFEGKPEVYHTPGNFVRFSALAREWKDRNLVPPFQYTEVRSVDVAWRDSSGKTHRYLLERVSDTAVRMVKPVAAPVPRKNAADIYVQTPQFALDEFVAAGDPNLAQAGLENPEVVLRISLLNGKSHTYKAGKAIGRFHYLRHPRHKSVVKVYKWRFDFFKKTPAELLAPPPPKSETQDGLDGDPAAAH